MGADAYTEVYTVHEWDRARIDLLPGVTLLEFGTAWCSVCRAAQHLVRTVVSECPGIRHVKIEDGPGRRLGRSFRITLWPTLIVLKDGIECGRAVRPASVDELRVLLSRVT